MGEKDKGREVSKKQVIVAVVLLFSLAVIGFTFATLCLWKFRSGFFYRYRLLFTVLFLVLVFITASLGFVFFFAGRETAYKLFLSALYFIDFAFIIFFVLLITGFLDVVHDVESFKKYLLSAGIWMDILFIVLQFLQVIILPIPSFVTLVAGTALFGGVRCFLYSFFAIVLGSITAFFIGRFLGYRAVSWMVGRDNLDNWLKKVKGKDNVVLTAMFLLPFFPDDILCFIAGLSSMTSKYFIIMITIARAISVSTTCFSVDLIPFNTWWGILLWVVIGIVAVTAFIWFYKNQEKLQNWLQKRKK